MKPPFKSRSGQPWVVALIVALATGWVLYAFPVGCSKSSMVRTACIANIKQSTTALLQYSEDWDHRLPDRDSWIDASNPYAKVVDVYRCVALHRIDRQAFGFALDSRMSHQDPKSVPDPESTPLAFDSLNLAKNASDPFLSMPTTPTTYGDWRRSIAYADGHAKFLEPRP